MLVQTEGERNATISPDQVYLALVRIRYLDLGAIDSRGSC